MYETLKVKRITLAAEAVAIRRIERKLKRRARRRKDPVDNLPKKHARGEESNRQHNTPLSDYVLTLEQRQALRRKIKALAGHRKLDVRRAARSAHLAHGYVRGTPYRKIEQFCYTKPSTEAIRRNLQEHMPNLVGNSSTTQVEEMVLAWLNGKEPPHIAVWRESREKSKTQ